MTDPSALVRITLRIPGKWADRKVFAESLPPGCKVTGEAFILPDGTQFDFAGKKADGQFAQIFRSSCRQPPTPEEQATVDRYTANIILSGPGGSMESARAMMQVAAIVIRAGGAGVFIDNSALAHGGQHWLEMTEDGGPDALSFAFVSIVRGKAELWTMGMHVLGLRDIVMKRSDVETGGFDIIEVIRYLAQGEKPVEDGHVIADLDGPRFRVSTMESDQELAGSPMHNPFGRLKLVSMRDIAETN